MNQNTSLKERIMEEMKSAMRNKEKQRLQAVRLILAAIKQREVDERRDLDDGELIALLDKMAKQRRESIEQYRSADRQDLVEQEQFELDVIQAYLPTALGEEEIDAMIEEAVTAVGATSMREMGKVMGILKPKLLGRADPGAVSDKVKSRLSGTG